MTLDYIKAASVIELEEKAITDADENFYKLTGYAARFHNVDRVNDIIMPGAFKKSLEKREQAGDNLQLYFNHDMTQPPIGNVVKAFEDGKGLKYEALLPKADRFVAERIYPQIKARSLKSNSFGYKIKSAERRKADGVRLLKEIDIWEISVVNTPANPAANVETIKGLIPYAELPIAKGDKPWDRDAAFKRLVAHFGSSDEIKSAFLFGDPDKPVEQWDRSLLIADLHPEQKSLCANRVAIYKAAAFVAQGALPEDAQEAIKGHLDRYYGALSHASPWDSIGVTEWKALDPGEREARLKGLGVTNDLARVLSATNLGGLREGDRSSGDREGRPNEETKALLETLSALSKGVAAILDSRTTGTKPK